jgi:hypothetical protein
MSRSSRPAFRRPQGNFFERIEEEFRSTLNMTASELRSWLRTAPSREVGWKGTDGSATESVGHAMGRRLAVILEKQSAELTPDDYVDMRKAIGFIRRHLAQEPANPVTSRWRYSLMNWGHDPMKPRDGHREGADAEGTAAEDTSAAGARQSPQPALGPC